MMVKVKRTDVEQRRFDSLRLGEAFLCRGIEYIRIETTYVRTEGAFGAGVELVRGKVTFFAAEVEVRVPTNAVVEMEFE